MSGKTHLIADESIGGIQREYVEVERKADVGDYVVYVNDANLTGEILKVISADYVNVVTTNMGEVYRHNYRVLQPTDIVHIEGKRYRLVDRKAEIDEKVLIVDAVDHYSMYSNGDIVIAEGTDEEGIINEKLAESNNPLGYIYDNEYLVLEPVADAIIANKSEPTVDARHASPEVVDLLANLARRVTSLENKLGSVEAQLADTQGNVEKLSEELEAVRYGNDELYGRLAHVEDERTQLQTVNITVNMPELPNDDVAKCVCEMLKRLATNGSERP